MYSLILLAATTVPSPTPTLGVDQTYENTGPGFLGFLAMAFMATLVFFLVRDMAKRIRRVRYRSQVRENAEGGSHGPNAEHMGIPIISDEAYRAARGLGTDTLERQKPDVSTQQESTQQESTQDDSTQHELTRDNSTQHESTRDDEE